MKTFSLVLILFLLSCVVGQNPGRNNIQANQNRVLENARILGSGAQSLGGILPDRYGKPLTTASGVVNFKTTLAQEAINNKDLFSRVSPLSKGTSGQTPSVYDRAVGISNIAGSGATMTQGFSSMAGNSRLAGRAGAAAGVSTLFNEGVKNRDLFQRSGSLNNPNKVDRVESGLNSFGAGADIMGGLARKNKKAQVVATGVGVGAMVGKGLYENRDAIGASVNRAQTKLNSPMPPGEKRILDDQLSFMTT